MRVIMHALLREDRFLAQYLENRWTKVQHIVVSMSEPDEGMNLAVLCEEPPDGKGDKIFAFRAGYGFDEIPQTEIPYNQLLYALIYWNGKGGCGTKPSIERQGATIGW
jgi:hypothetical protein